MTGGWDRLLAPVQVQVAGAENLARVGVPVVLAANHASPLDAQLVGRVAPAHLHLSVTLSARPTLALRLGRSVVVFPEHGISPDGSLGHFHADELEAAALHEVPVVPVAIRGSLGLDEPPSRRALARSRSADQPRVLVRFGTPMTAPRPDEVRAAIRALLAEDAGTWWQAITEPDPRHTPDADVAAPSTGWLAAWQSLAPAERPGADRRPNIWS